MHGATAAGSAHAAMPIRGALAAIEQASKGWRRRLDMRTAASGMPDSHAVGDLLLHAFPDRIARRDDSNPLRYTLANGRGARLHENTALLGEPWLVALDLRFEARDSLILRRRTARSTRARTRLSRAVRARARAALERSSAAPSKRSTNSAYAAIVLERRSVPVKPEDALPALLAAVRAKGIDTLPWSENARRLRARMQALARMDAGARPAGYLRCAPCWLRSTSGWLPTWTASAVSTH